MNHNKYNEQSYNRRRQWYRVRLGAQQMVNRPIINLVWLLFGGGVVWWIKGMNTLLLMAKVHPLLNGIFEKCIGFINIVFPVVCLIALLQFVGHLTACKDESVLIRIFAKTKDIQMYPPILIYKKYLKDKKITIREYYTPISMACWRDKKDAICDQMNIHLIADLTYGGKKQNIGNRVIMKSADGRKPIERGVLYDDTF